MSHDLTTDTVLAAACPPSLPTARHAASFPALALCAAIVACGTSEPAEGGGAVVRDSAGIAIVENRTPAWTADARWSVDSEPSLTIGVDEGDPQREFHRITDVRWLPGGRIVVANAGSSELRYFSSTGDYLCSAGGQGAGPGEFERLDWLQPLPGDSLLAYAYGGGGRLSLFASNGTFVRTIPIGRVSGVDYTQAVGFLSSGLTVLRGGRAYRVGVPSGTRRDSVIMALARGESLTARIGPLPSIESVVVASENSMSVTGVMFGRNMVWAHGNGRLFIGTNDSYEFTEYDTLGQPIRIVRLDGAPEPVTDRAIAYVESARLANARSEAERARNRAFFEQTRYPATMPAYGNMLADDLGNLWVMRYDYLPRPRVWDVFDTTRQWLGDVTLPVRFYPRQISDGQILGIGRDESDVESVRVHQIRKGDGRPPTTNERRVGSMPDDDRPSAYRACVA